MIWDTSTKLWRKGWLSELEAILFVENTITLLGGWFWVPKDAGTIAADVSAGATTVDFGKTMTVGDFVIFRSSLAVEYMKVGSLVSGTTYNVTPWRNLDGSGANAWASGQPFAVLGASGAGRIELNAYDTPRIQLIRQGATYNSQTELIRIGDLNGGWGYVAETWGLAMGQYQSGYANITIDPTNGFRLRNYNTTVIQLDNSGNATIAGSLTIGAAGGVYQADGDVWLDDGGLGFDYTIGGDTSSVKWLNSGTVFASIVGMAIGGVRGMQFVAQRYQFFDGSNNQANHHDFRGNCGRWSFGCQSCGYGASATSGVVCWRLLHPTAAGTFTRMALGVLITGATSSTVISRRR